MPTQQNGRVRKEEATLSGTDLLARAGAHVARGFPIVGIGASAGGLDAFKAFLAAMPSDTGMAFVLVQHLDPIHVSLMAGLLSGHTTMPVTQAAEGVSIEPNRVYLIPPGSSSRRGSRTSLNPSRGPCCGAAVNRIASSLLLRRCFATSVSSCRFSVGPTEEPPIAHRSACDESGRTAHATLATPITTAAHLQAHLTALVPMIFSFVLGVAADVRQPFPLLPYSQIKSAHEFASYDMRSSCCRSTQPGAEEICMPTQQNGRVRKEEATLSGTDLLARAGAHVARGFPIVGIGASAGGLDAFKAFLAAMPSDTGMAFVLVQHLDPIHVSLMAGLLSGHTTMPVTQAAEGVSIEPNRVYLIPPGVSLAVAGGKLHLSELTERHGARTAFDVFLRSLAEDCGERAIGVVLSGSGSDGSEGVKAVKSKGGFVIVQEPSEAAFDGMPKSAIQTGQADCILPVAKIPAALIKRMTCFHPADANPAANEGTEEPFLEVLSLVRTKTGHDFSLYKTGTLTRRIERRMAMAGITETARYLEKLNSEQTELDSLAHDLLINVTEFFRDAAAFQVLAETVVPEMVALQQPDKPLRIWVPGCSTGEEAYGLAILFLEAIAASKRAIKLQVFASDVDPHAIAFARVGLYGRETESQVSPERLSRFFVHEGSGFRVVRDLRDAVVFTVQDLLADPPFSRLDLISCRNVLIYLQPSAQEQILSLFHFALRAGGVLFLGRSETVGQFKDRFEPIDKKQHIYRHLSAGRPGEGGLRLSSVKERLAPATTPALVRRVRPFNAEDLAAKQLLETLAPPSVLVDKTYEATFCFGAIDLYLQVTSGVTNRNILVMAREGLRPKLRAALEKARETGELASKSGARFHRDGTAHSVKIVAQPVPAGEMLLVSFVEEATRRTTAN